MHPNEKELRDQTGFKKRTKDRQEYLLKLSMEIDKLSDDKWEILSNEAQLWANEAISARQVGADIKDFETKEEPEEEEQKDKDSSDTPDWLEKPFSKNDDKPKDKKKKAKSTKTVKRGKRDLGIKIRIKEKIIEDPKISVNDLVSALEKDGQSASKFTISGIRAEFRHSLRFLKSKGLIDIEL